MIAVLKAVLKAVDRTYNYDTQKIGRKAHTKPYESIRWHKLCCNHTHGIHPETEMESKTKAGGKALPGPDHHP